MHCTLDLELTPDIIFQTDSALTALLTKASVEIKEGPLTQLRLQQSGINSTTSMAAVAAKADGLNEEGGSWVVAAPVHLVLQRDAFSLYPEAPIKLSAHEAAAYQVKLNEHFQTDGIQFKVGRSGQWYVHVKDQGMFSDFDGLTHPSHALGQKIDAFMPKHAEAHQWLQLQNEIQMLLFDSAENQVREQLGQLPVNSVWFYGAGVISANHQPESDICYLSSAPFYQGLAQQAQASCEELPEALASIKNIIKASNASAMVLDLTGVTDLEPWLTNCQRWLKQGLIKSLTLQLGQPRATLVADIKRIDYWRFWRKQHTVDHYFQ